MSGQERPSGRPTGRAQAQPYEPGGQDVQQPKYRRESSASESVVTPRRRGPGRVGLLGLADELCERDFAVLELLALHRFMTTEQLRELIFTNHQSDESAARTCRRVLARLERLDVIERPARRVGGLLAGSAPSVWRLTAVGVRLRALVDGRGAVGRVRDTGDRFIAHHVAVADIHLRLVRAQRLGKLTLHALGVEPGTWRHYEFGGSSRVLKPDLFAVISTRDDPEHDRLHWVEVDLATESLPTVVRESRQYLEMKAVGQMQREEGVFPWVVWVAPDERRASRIAAALKEARSIDTALFKVTTPEHFVDMVTEPLP